MGDKGLMESFIRCTVEILNYVLEIAASSSQRQVPPMLLPNPTDSSAPSTAMIDANTNELLLSTTPAQDTGHSSTVTTSAPENAIVYDLQEIRNYYQYCYLSDDFLTNTEEIYKDEDPREVVTIRGTTPSTASTSYLPVTFWPKKYDLKLILLHYEYYFHQKYATAGANPNPSANPNPGSSSASSSSSRVAHQYYIWNNKYQIFYHISVLYILQLRFICGLRGLKPSQLLGPRLLDLIQEGKYYEDYVEEQVDWKKVNSSFRVTTLLCLIDRLSSVSVLSFFF